MASKYLGESVDLHGGGKDLKFPHHESEAMICEAVFGTDWARYWMHNGFLTLESEKMSKSLGNFVTIRDVVSKWGGEVVRFCLLKEQYRKDCEYDADCFRITKEELAGIHSVIGLAKSGGGPATAGKVEAAVRRVREGFFAAMEDDFDTPSAAYALIEFTEAIVGLGRMSREEGGEVLRFYAEASRILGVFEAAQAAVVSAGG